MTSERTLLESKKPQSHKHKWRQISWEGLINWRPDWSPARDPRSCGLAWGCRQPGTRYTDGDHGPDLNFSLKLKIQSHKNVGPFTLWKANITRMLSCSLIEKPISQECWAVHSLKSQSHKTVGLIVKRMSQECWTVIRMLGCNFYLHFDLHPHIFCFKMNFSLISLNARANDAYKKKLTLSLFFLMCLILKFF